jgi:hypothetical protein
MGFISSLLGAFRGSRRNNGQRHGNKTRMGVFKVFIKGHVLIKGA